MVKAERQRQGRVERDRKKTFNTGVYATVHDIRDPVQTVGKRSAS